MMFQDDQVAEVLTKKDMYGYTIWNSRICSLTLLYIEIQKVWMKFRGIAVILTLLDILLLKSSSYSNETQ